MRSQLRIHFALGLFDYGAIEFGEGFRFKHHEGEPDAPLSPVKVNLRRLTDVPLARAGLLLRQVAEDKGLQFDYVIGIPNAGKALGKAFLDQYRSDEFTPLCLEMGKAQEGDQRRIGTVLTDENIHGEVVLPIDDVVTKGETKVETLKELQKTGAVVTDFLVVVDREEGGSELLEASGYRVHSVFTLEELMQILLDHDRIDQARFDEVKTYVNASKNYSR